MNSPVCIFLNSIPGNIMFTNETLSELLILFLLLLVNIRFLFIRKIKYDTLSVVAIVCFFISILSILSFGLSFVRLIILIVSFFTALWNMRAFQRLYSGLVIDNFGFLSIFSSFLNFALTAVILVFVIYYREPVVKEEKFSVIKTQEFYTQCDNYFFKKADGLFDKKNVRLWKIQEGKDGYVKTSDVNHLILFVVPEASSLEIYQPFLYKLARDGFVVYAAEVSLKGEKLFSGIYNLKFNRRFFSRYLKFRKPEKYAELCKEKESDRITKCSVLLDIVNPTGEETVHFVFDDETSVMQAVQEKYLMPWDTVFDLSSVEAYKTAGYGPIENTDPVICKIMNISSDKSFYISSHLATALEKLVYYYHE